MKQKLTYADGVWVIFLWLLMVGSWWGIHGPVLLYWSALLAGALAFLIVYDFRHFLLPNLVTLPLLAVGLVYQALQDMPALIEGVIGSVAAMMFMVALNLIYKALRGRDGLGYGDAKLMGAAGAWLGWEPLSIVLLLGSLSALSHIAARALLSLERIDAQKQIAFGPYLAFGIWLSWLLRPILFPAY